MKNFSHSLLAFLLAILLKLKIFIFERLAPKEKYYRKELESINKRILASIERKEELIRNIDYLNVQIAAAGTVSTQMLKSLNFSGLKTHLRQYFEILENVSENLSGICKATDYEHRITLFFPLTSRLEAIEENLNDIMAYLRKISPLTEQAFDIEEMLILAAEGSKYSYKF